jgi:hypothetical protein
VLVRRRFAGIATERKHAEVGRSAGGEGDPADFDVVHVEHRFEVLGDVHLLSLPTFRALDSVAAIQDTVTGVVFRQRHELAAGAFAFTNRHFHFSNCAAAITARRNADAQVVSAYSGIC